jgi:hypothetical protein
MTSDQADAMLAALGHLSDQLDALIWLGTAAVLGIGLVWGSLQWRLTLLSKNQKHFW